MDAMVQGGRGNKGEVEQNSVASLLAKHEERQAVEHDAGRGAAPAAAHALEVGRDVERLLKSFLVQEIDFSLHKKPLLGQRQGEKTVVGTDRPAAR